MAENRFSFPARCLPLSQNNNNTLTGKITKKKNPNCGHSRIHGHNFLLVPLIYLSTPSYHLIPIKNILIHPTSYYKSPFSLGWCDGRVSFYSFSHSFWPARSQNRANSALRALFIHTPSPFTNKPSWILICEGKCVALPSKQSFLSEFLILSWGGATFPSPRFLILMLLKKIFFNICLFFRDRAWTREGA